MNIAYSILDLATIVKGDSVSDTFQKSVRAAQIAEELGFTRYWFSEHHNFPNVASAATSLLIGHIANHTRTIRVGSGGIMLPNHSTLSVAEQFGTLEALFSDRIDLGLGRAPGTDSLTASVLRRGNFGGNYDFEFHIRELLQYFNTENAAAKVRAIPGEGASVPVYILGSSTDSAYLAAKMGMPYAFAGHFAPAQMRIATEIYRSQFQASEFLKEPYVILCVNIIAADTSEEATFLARSHYQAFVNIITDQRQPLLPPDEVDLSRIPDEVEVHLRRMTAGTFVGDRDMLQEDLQEFITACKPQEIMVSGNIYNFEKKLHSYSLISQIFRNL